jgi:hypothetical protein
VTSADAPTEPDTGVTDLGDIVGAGFDKLAGR